MPKKDEKSTKKDKGCCFKNECCQFGDELIALVKKAKTKYENLDPKAKKAVMAGIAGGVALIAGAVGAHHSKKKK